ncbi:MAG TPA: NAD(P)H-dependent oxidoreductase, partial [Chthoniobacterales bacterium]|nr:NAD(P)H-dependent oxidoreductase [Chthoniobacterales bacterium]
MSGPKEYLVISSSLRTSSRSRILADYLREYYESQPASCAYLDLRAVNLPLCDGESAYNHPDVSQCAKL